MKRHDNLLNSFSRSKSDAELLNKLRKSRKAVKVYGNGTSGLKLKWQSYWTFKKTSNNI